MEPSSDRDGEPGPGRHLRGFCPAIEAEKRYPRVTPAERTRFAARHGTVTRRVQPAVVPPTLTDSICILRNRSELIATNSDPANLAAVWEAIDLLADAIERRPARSPAG
jgi:hypothetical protein